MTTTPTELLAPHKHAVVVAVRDYLRAAGTDGIAFEIPNSVPNCVVVMGDEARVGELLRTPEPEPMVGGRRPGDVPPPELEWEEPAVVSPAEAVRALLLELATFEGRLVSGDHLARRASEVLALQAKAERGYLTNEQITAGAAVECEHGQAIGRNVAIDVFDAMTLVAGREGGAA